ncbi:MAG: DUF4363 family protein [Oscillospiraceae bacterium]
MKRETVAVIILLLLCAAVTWNVFYVNDVTEELCQYVETSRDAYARGDYATAESEVHRAIDTWGDSGGYTYVSLRHTEIDTITDAFYDLLSEIYDRSDESTGGYEHVIASLKRMADMENPSIGSIF